jgi:hypothetical protein
MEQFLPLILSAVGGTVLGPLISKFTGGNMSGGLLGGVLGGVAAHFGLEAANVQALGNAALGATDPVNMLNSVLEGGVGGGVLGTIAGMVMKKKA